jgi:hypothetical protein
VTRTAVDRAIALVLGAAAIAYLVPLPRYLGPSDESSYLYGAVRLLHGQVVYRDFFTVWAPGAYWAMALVFRLFGAQLATAKAATAVLHGAIVAVLYAACRALGVRRAIAVPVALAHLALFQPAWPYASGHWLTTLLTLVVLWTLLVGPASGAPRAAIVPGIVVGLVIAVQHHKGAFLALGVPALFLAQHLAAGTTPLRALAARVAWFGAGLGAVVVPIGLVLVGTAGAANVFDALVLQPLRYHESFRIGFGQVHAMSAIEARSTLPLVLRWLPAALAPPVVRAAVAVARPERRAALRTDLVLIVVPATALLGVLYFPDFVHLAFTGPLFAVLVADALERLLRALDGRPRVARLASAAIGLAGIVAATGWMAANARRSVADRAAALDTPFGRVDFRAGFEPEMLGALAALGARAGARWVFAYPVYPIAYLVTGMENPTRYDFALAGFLGPAQQADMLRSLETRPVPYVLVLKPFVRRGADPVLAHVAAAYVPVADFDRFPGVALYRRDDARRSASAAIATMPATDPASPTTNVHGR